MLTNNIISFEQLGRETFGHLKPLPYFSYNLNISMTTEPVANSVEPHQTIHSSASDLDLHFFS